MEWTLSAFADEAGNSCEEQIAALRRAGLSWIDIRNMDGYNITAMPADHARRVKEKLDKAGIRAGMLGSPIGKIDINQDVAEDLRRLRQLAELAPLLNCRSVRIFSFYNADGRPHNEWRKESINRLRQLREIAAESGLVLFHENEKHILGDLCDDVLTIADELRDGKNFGLIFDFDNYCQSGEDTWENWLRLKDKTDAFHLKDSRNGEHMPVGQGDGQVEKILADARARSWAGALSIEPHLQHSVGVAMTGPSGISNQQYGQLDPAESFQIACTSAVELLRRVGAEAGAS